LADETKGSVMTMILTTSDTDVLASWAATRQAPRRRGTSKHGTPAQLRFAFYGRVSTEEYQDQASSARWQLDFANELVAGRGRIVAQFFDTGYSRRLPWPERPRAAALLATVTDPEREFDAIVVGEYERAFYGEQLLQMAPIFKRHGVQLWLPELNGPVDIDNPTHVALMMLLGVQSKREILRARFRVIAAMRAQTRDQGRHLGGRPPYGYQLVDAGPHPNTIHASWGRRLHRLEPDPQTAPHVRWMFTQRLAGLSFANIARQLNDRGIPCPSAADPDRNRHRSGQAWTLQTVAAILANPRYTGRQIWNRQRTDREPRHDVLFNLHGLAEPRRWNPTNDWAISHQAAHEGLVNEQDFVAAQAIRAPRPAEDGTTRTYLLTGLLRCGICHRRMDGHWVNERPGYRCRHGHTSARTTDPNRLRNLYIREDHVLAALASHRQELTLTGLPPTLGHDPYAIVAFLRTNQMTLTTNGTTVTAQAAEDPKQAGPCLHQRNPETQRPAHVET
jgi:DNA invertase Pin-like site-specific DNA recombinase